MSATPFRLTGASRATIAARHTSLLNACLMWLAAHRVPAHKMNSGAIEGAHGRFIRFGFPGCPDVIGILPGGKFLGVECKTGTGRLTPDQDAFRIVVENSGGVFVLVRELCDLEAAVKPFVSVVVAAMPARIVPKAKRIPTQGVEQKIARKAAKKRPDKSRMVTIAELAGGQRRAAG